MKVKHISIAVDPEQTGNPVFGAPADLTAYILEPVEGITDKKRPAVLLCPGGGYHKLSGGEVHPFAMRYLELVFMSLCFTTAWCRMYFHGHLWSWRFP